MKQLAIDVPSNAVPAMEKRPTKIEYAVPGKLLLFYCHIFTFHHLHDISNSQSSFALRSLQLTERSPVRTQSHKTVLKIGGNGTSKERVPSHQLYVAPAPVAAVPPPSNRRIVRTQAMTNEQRYKENRNIDLEKSRSLDSEYERYQYSDFDKSRSFDEDYGTKSANKYLEDNRSFSIDHVYSQGPRKVNSPPNYNNSSGGGGGGTNARLYDHDMLHEMVRSQRSPVIDNYRRQQQKHGGSTRNNRKRSPNLNRDASYRSMSRNMDQSKVFRDPSPSNVSTIVVNHSTTLGSSGGHTSPGSDYDGNAGEYDFDYESSVRGNAKINDELIKEAKMVTDFLYGNNHNKSTKADTYLNSQRRRDTKPSNRSHASAGTNTASSSSSVAAVRYIRN